MAYTPRAEPVAAALLGLALLAAACGEPDLEALPPPPPSTTVPPITVPEAIPDTRSVNLGGVGGLRPGDAPVAVLGGGAELTGRVTGPGGPVADATVRVERFEGTRSASLDVTTGPDGRFRVAKAHGGRYRTRAWSTPRLGMTESVLSFLPDGKVNEIDLVLSVQDGADIQAVVSESSVPVDGEITVTALVTRRSVGADGIISAAPEGNARATMAGSAAWELVGDEARSVDADGRVAWTLRCVSPGSFITTVRALGVLRDVTLTCVRPVDDSPDAVPYPDSTLEIGNQFSPPFDAVVPAGDYLVVDDSGTCGFSYQRWLDGEWQQTRRTVVGTGDFTFEYPGRDLRTIGDTPPCVYERVA